MGGGGREHAIIRKIGESPKVREIHCAPGNGGIRAQGVHCEAIAAADIPAMVDYAREQAFDLVVVTPDDPLVLGMADALEARGIPAFGPSKAAAAIEGSKVFAKELMQRHGIPTARHKSFSDSGLALAYIRALDEWPVVVKADGLALGKGVVIAQDMAQAKDAVLRIMEDKAFGASGNAIVVEQFLSGPEVSVLAFCDGDCIVPMISCMDHKRAFDGNLGPNTGGMGAIAPNPHYTPEMAQRCMNEIFLPTVRAMKAEGRPFKGCLYFGLMLTPDGPMVIEYNCRFGDPETQAILPLLATDLVEIMLAVRKERLCGLDIRWREGAAACVVLASAGYPGGFSTGFPILGPGPDGQLCAGQAAIYHAGTKAGEQGGFVTSGGRVLGVSATGRNVREAAGRAYDLIGEITFEKMHYRKDIGKF